MSKGLEALNSLKFDISVLQDINHIEVNKKCNTIEKYLKSLEKMEETIQETVAKLLKKRFEIYLYKTPKSHQYYLWIGNDVFFLNKEQYKLLKEVLE